MGRCVIIVTDVDGTMISNRPYFNEVPFTLRKAISLGYFFVFATAKTVYEVVNVLESMGIVVGSEVASKIMIISELGSAIYHKGVIMLDGPPLNISGTRFSEVSLAKSLDHVKPLILKAVSPCRDKVKLFTELDDSEISELTGLPREFVSGASKRRYTEVVWGPRRCLEEAAERAKSLGLSHAISRRGNLLHLGAFPGKAAALMRALDLLPLRRLAVYGIGDSEQDTHLYYVDYPILIPSGGEGAGLWFSRSDYIISCSTAPEGWALAVEHIILGEGVSNCSL